MLKKIQGNLYEIDNTSPIALIQNIYDAAQNLYFPAMQGNEMLHDIKDSLESITKNIEKQVKEIQEFNNLMNNINESIISCDFAINWRR